MNGPPPRRGVCVFMEARGENTEGDLSGFDMNGDSELAEARFSSPALKTETVLCQAVQEIPFSCLRWNKEWMSHVASAAPEFHL